MPMGKGDLIRHLRGKGYDVREPDLNYMVRAGITTARRDMPMPITA